jgi:hypothetical protein
VTTNAKEKLKTMSQISLLIVMDVKSAGTAFTLPKTHVSATMAPRTLPMEQPPSAVARTDFPAEGHPE